MSYLAQLKAVGADRGVAPVPFELVGSVLTKPIRAHSDGRIDLLDTASNMYEKRSAACQAVKRLLYDTQVVNDTESLTDDGQSLLGFPLSAFSKVRWEGQGGSHDSIVAFPNVAIAMLLALKTRGGTELKAALATELARAMQAKAGLSDAEIQALEAQTTNPQLTNAVAAAAGVPVLPEQPQAAAAAPVVTIGDNNVAPTNNGGDLTANPNVNVTVHAPAPPKSPSSADGNELQATGPPITLLIELAGNVAHPAHGWAMGMLGSVQKTAVAHADKEVEYLEQEREKTKQVQEHTKQVQEHTEQERAKTQQVQTEAAKAEDERVDAKEARKRKMAIDESEWERTSKLRTIKSTFSIAREMGQATPALREQLAARLTSNEIVASDDLSPTAVPPPEIETAKSYAERLLGRSLTDAGAISKLRADVNAAYLRVFKKPASTVLPQVREGTSIVASFHTRELAHPSLHGIWPR